MNVTERDIGQLEAKVENLELEVQALRADVREILNELAQAKGGWKLLMAVGGLSGVIGAGLAKAVSVFFK